MREHKDNPVQELLPKIRIIACQNLTLGPGGRFHWLHKDLRGPYWRIYWNNSPGAFVSCGGREIEITPQKIIVLSPDATYSTRAEKLTSHFYIHCFVDYPFPDIRERMFELSDIRLTHQASLLADKVNTHASEWRIQMELMVYLQSVFLAIPSEKNAEQRQYSPRIVKTIETIERKCNVSNLQLARQINMSRNAFLFLFKKETRTTPQAYSRQVRINEACAMLHHSDKSIDEIAQETGFCDRYHFSRAFRQLVGCAPAQFRKERYPDVRDYAKSRTK